MAANQFGSFVSLPLVNPHPEAELHGVEVDREDPCRDLVLNIAAHKRLEK